jgi:hypothetical protein
MLQQLNQTKTEGEDEKKKFIKELKIQKIKLKPLIEDYKLSLEKLKTELLLSNNHKNKKRKTNNNNNNNNNNNRNKKFKSSTMNENK